MDTDTYPYCDTQAARMLASGIRRLSAEQNISQRELARRLGYKQSVVFSHMASGRVRIPLEQAEAFAEALSLDRVNFLQAVLKQRLPNTEWGEILASKGANIVVQNLEAIAGQSIEAFSQEQLSVMREVAADAHPRRRWLSVHELAAVELLRRLRPEIAISGLSAEEHRSIEITLS